MDYAPPAVAPAATSHTRVQTFPGRACRRFAVSDFFDPTPLSASECRRLLSDQILSKGRARELRVRLTQTLCCVLRPRDLHPLSSILKYERRRSIGERDDFSSSLATFVEFTTFVEVVTLRQQIPTQRWRRLVYHVKFHTTTR